MSGDIFDEDHNGKKDKSRDLELLAISTLMSTNIGRDFMWRCLRDCRLYQDVYNENPLIHALNAGKRKHGVWLEAELKEASFDDYIKMLKEHENE